MVQSFLQFLNVGFGIINNTQPVERWDIDGAMEKALTIDDPTLDIRIIGFRFYDIDNTTNNIVKQSGIYYLEGDIFTYPKIDNEIALFMKNTNADFPRGQQLIKIKKPYVLVYLYHENDTIVNIESIMEKIKIKKEQERLLKLNQDVVQYKNNLIQALRKIETSIEDNNFNLISMTEPETPEGPRLLNILNDRGVFSKHVDYLRNTRIEIMNLEKYLNGSSML
jgi:hypothetical protein